MLRSKRKNTFQKIFAFREDMFQGRECASAGLKNNKVCTFVSLDKAFTVLQQESQSQMESDQEYMVTLLRLVLPANSSMEKVLVGLESGGEQQFIIGEKHVRNQRVNFYRECLFIKDIGKQLIIRVYSVGGDGSKQLAKSFLYGAQELSSVSKRAAMFHSELEGFQIVWECSAFRENQASELNYETDKEYTQLQLDLHQDETSLAGMLASSQASHEEQFENNCIFKDTKSTQETLNDAGPEVFHWRLQQDFGVQRELGYQARKGKKIQSEQGDKSGKKKHLKSQIYNHLLSEFTGLFSLSRN